MRMESYAFDRSFYVDKQSNEIYYYPVGKEKEDVVLYAKCDIGRENMYRDRMIGGVFEGSNYPDFWKKTLCLLYRADLIV